MELTIVAETVPLKNQDGVLRKSSPFDIRSANLPITKLDLIEAIRESRARFSLTQMAKTTDMDAVELVSSIRDQQAERLRGKSDQEIIEFFRKAGAAASAAPHNESLPLKF